MREIAAARGRRRRSRASPTREETQFSFATKKTSTRARQAQVEGADDVPRQRRKGYDLEEDVPVVHRLRGQRAARQGEQRRAVGRIVARHGGLCIGSGPGELYDQKKFDTPYIRDFLLDRGDPRRRVGDRGAVERARAGVRRRDGGRARRRSPGSACRATSCATSRTRTTRAPASTSRSRSCRRAAQVPIDGLRRASRRRSSRRSSTRARRSRTTTRWAPSTPAGSSRTSPRPGVGDAPRALRRRRPGRQPQPGQDHGVAEAARERNHGDVHLESHPAGWSPSRSRARRSPSPRPPRPLPRSRRPRHGRERQAALVPGPLYGLRTWSVAGADGEERLEGPLQPAPWPPGGEWLTATCAVDPRHAAPEPGCTLRDPRLAPAPERGAPRARVLAAASRASSRPAARWRSTATASAPSAPGPARSSPRARSNAALLGRLAEAYRAEVVRRRRRRTRSSPGAASTTSGSPPAVVDELLGPRGRRRASAARAAPTRLRLAGVAFAIAIAILLGLEFTADPGDRPLFGRTAGPRLAAESVPGQRRARRPVRSSAGSASSLEPARPTPRRAPPGWTRAGRPSRRR